jgi:dipeptidyl aminopeptidase/acylaminoacyl peptidase
MTTKTLIISSIAAALALVGCVPAVAVDRTAQTSAKTTVQQITIAYRAHNGATSHAVVLLPSGYSPQYNPSIPLVISPHGRGLWGKTNAKLWGTLPTLGGFAVVNPDGAGDHLSGRFAWGAKGDIDDLARMPQILHEALPWLHIDTHRLYAVGGSMGGQETLLLLGEHPHLLAGAVAVDSLVDFARQYANFATFKCDKICRSHWRGSIGRTLQTFVRREAGGTPATAPEQFAERSPLTYARAIATSGVQLQIWWSHTDKVIVHPELHSGRLAKLIREINPSAPLTVHTGRWVHTHVLRYDRQLPKMLIGLGLLDASDL